MNKSQYQNYLSTYTWRILRAKAFNFHGKKCKKCGAQNNLQVHHRTYVRVGGDEDVEKDLVPLCDECHEIIHETVANEGLTIYEATRVYLGEPPVVVVKKRHRHKRAFLQAQVYTKRRNQPPASLPNTPRKPKQATPIDLKKLRKMYGLDAVPAFLLR